MIREASLRRIQKLLNLAGSNPTTPEQMAAYWKAQTLMKRMGVDKDLRPLAIEGEISKTHRLFEKIKTIKKFSFADLLLNKEYVRMRIIPDSSARNWRTEDIVRTIADQFTLPIDRIVMDGIKLTGIRIQERAMYEIEFLKDSICFYLHIPKHIAPLIQRRIYSVWDKATVEVEKAVNPFDVSKTTVYELLYKRHDLYSLHTDAKDNFPLPSILEAGTLVEKDERASVFAFFDPMQQVSWQFQLSAAWDKLRRGGVPRRKDSSAKAVIRALTIGLASVIQEIVSGLSEVFSNGKEGNVYANRPVDPEAAKYSLDNLSHNTREKMSKPGIKTYLWTIAESSDPTRADLIARTMAFGFYDLAGDNELEARRLGKSRRQEVLKSIHTYTPPKVNIRYNIMSTSEASKIVQIPGADLQEKHHEIGHIHQTQTEVVNRDLLDKKGILLGDTTFKGDTVTIYQPTKDEDEVCLPHVGIGGMGQGKTRGLLSNFALESVLKGYGSLSIDPAKRQIGEELKAAVDAGILRPDQFVHVDLGEEIFALDFCEAMYDERARSRLANMIIYFFGIADETSGQTERYLRAAVAGMEAGRLEEIMHIFEREERLDKAIEKLTKAEDEYNSQTLKEYKGYQTGMRRKITSPIYNRINEILGDSHLAKCMKSDKSIDMVEILSQRKAFVFDVPADSLDKLAIDLIVNLLSLKIDIAMRMRKKVKGAEFEFPFFVLIDEPHQFSKSTALWEDAVVESRKWKICYFWTFHYWEQLPSKLQKAIRNALPHYHLYPTSTTTFEQLKAEIYPFTVHDALKMKRWHAINIIRSDGENITPFIAKMTAPPSVRFT